MQGNLDTDFRSRAVDAVGASSGRLQTALAESLGSGRLTAPANLLGVQRSSTVHGQNALLVTGLLNVERDLMERLLKNF